MFYGIEDAETTFLMTSKGVGCQQEKDPEGIGFFFIPSGSFKQD